MDDQRIVDLYFERNEQAIKETEDKYGKLCQRIAYNILNNPEDAEEVVNDTLAGIWNTIPPTRPSNLMAFICGIARNLSLKRLEFLRREKRSVEMTVSLDELADILPDERYVPNVNDEDIAKMINTFLHKQKKDIRKVFIRRYYFFDSIKEISEKYAFTESKVKNMLFNTRKKMKNYLIKEGVEI